jgi:pseudouridine-5'-monophosphatase
LAPYNKQLTWEIKAMLMGRPSEESAKILIERTGIPLSPEELLSMLSARQRTLFSTVQPMPGALKLVQHLHKFNVPIAVSHSLDLSSASYQAYTDPSRIYMLQKNVDWVLNQRVFYIIKIATGSSSVNYDLKSENQSELFSVFQGKVICGDDPDLKRGKPNPDPFLLAAARHLGMKLEPDPVTGFLEPPPVDQSGPTTNHLRPDQILVFEDGLAGVEAAKAAGMKVVWVPDPELKNLLTQQNHQTPHHLKPDQTLTSLLDWNGQDWALPPFES